MHFFLIKIDATTIKKFSCENEILFHRKKEWESFQENSSFSEGLRFYAFRKNIQILFTSSVYNIEDN